MEVVLAVGWQVDVILRQRLVPRVVEWRWPVHRTFHGTVRIGMMCFYCKIMRRAKHGKGEKHRDKREESKTLDSTLARKLRARRAQWLNT